jgi:hypothetical protein
MQRQTHAKQSGAPCSMPAPANGRSDAGGVQGNEGDGDRSACKDIAPSILALFAHSGRIRAHLRIPFSQRTCITGEDALSGAKSIRHGVRGGTVND